MTELRASSQRQKPGSSSSVPGVDARELRPCSHPREDGQAGFSRSPPRWQRRRRAASGHYLAVSRRYRAGDSPPVTPGTRRQPAPTRVRPARSLASVGRRALPKRRFGSHGVCPEQIPAPTPFPPLPGEGAHPRAPSPLPPGRCNASLCRTAAERHGPAAQMCPLPTQMCSPATAGEEPAARTVKEGQLHSPFPWAGGKAGVACCRRAAPEQRSGNQGGSQILPSEKHLAPGMKTLKTLCLPTGPVPANLLVTALLRLHFC